MPSFLMFRRVLVTVAFLSLAACGGGGGSGSEIAQTTLSTHELNFSAAGPDEAVPATQVVTATFSKGVVMLAVTHSGSAVGTATYTATGTTAQISVVPATPETVGAGKFTGAIAVTGYVCSDSSCTSLAAGNTETIKVNYSVAPAVRFVGPYVGTTNVGATVSIRGQGFTAFPVTAVSFGATAATSFTTVSDTEITAAYPALPAGSYSVKVTAPTSPSAITTTATLAVVDPPVNTATLLQYPTANPTLRDLIFDGERKALLVAVDSNGGTILRYPFAGGTWGAPTSAAVADLQDFSLSANGTEIFALTKTGIVRVNPVTLALGSTTAATGLSSGHTLKDIVITNENNGVVTTGASGTTYTPLFAFQSRKDTLALSPSGAQLDNASVGVSANGATAIIVQGDPSLTTAPLVYAFSASTEQLSSYLSVTLNQSAVPPVLSRGATRVALNGLNVYDNTVLMGTLPATTLAVAFKPDGTRAYTYDSNAGAILTYDTSAAVTNSAAFTQLGTVNPVPGAPGNGVRMTISLDGSTLFLAGSTQVIVMPTPTY